MKDTMASGQEIEGCRIVSAGGREVRSGEQVRKRCQTRDRRVWTGVDRTNGEESWEAGGESPASRGESMSECVWTRHNTTHQSGLAQRSHISSTCSPIRVTSSVWEIG